MRLKGPNKGSISHTVAIVVLGVVACGQNRSTVGSNVLEPGDRRIDFRGVVPDARIYEVHYLKAADSATEDTIVGHLTERLEERIRNGVDVLLRVRTMRYTDGASEIDSVLLDRSTLAPYQVRTNRSDQGYRAGIDIRGLRASHFGPTPEERVDTLLTSRFFLAGTETLLIPEILRNGLSALPVQVPVVDFIQTDWVFSFDYRTIAVSPLAEDSLPGVLSVTFGSDTYWLERGKLRVLRWQRRPIEGTFVVQFIARDEH